MRDTSGSLGQSAWATVVLLFLVLITPLTPFVVGAIEIARYDTHLALKWVQTTAVEETIAEFYRSLGWPC